MSRRAIDPTAQEIGERLRELRIGSGVTMSELAEAAEISISQLWNIERGRAKISVSRLRTLADALEVDPIALQVLEDEPEPKQDERRR